MGLRRCHGEWDDRGRTVCAGAFRLGRRGPRP